MFGWFKKKQPATESQDNKVLVVSLGMEGGLKGVENYWKVGEHKKGDELLNAIANACMQSLSAAHGNPSDDNRRHQFQILKSILLFLSRHRKNQLIKDVTERIVKFNIPGLLNSEQLAFLVNYLDNAAESDNNKTADGQTNHRLVYYSCQGCGCFNLIATAPCVYCGFIAKNEKELRRAFLLSSLVMQAPAIFHYSRIINYSSKSTPRDPSYEEVWAILDKDILTQTKHLNNEVPKLLENCGQNLGSFEGPPNFQIRCRDCQNLQNVLPGLKEQSCKNCKNILAIPHMRKLKAALSSTLLFVLTGMDPREDVKFSNFVATFVLLTDYALRRNIPPSIAQGRDLIDRFASLGTVTFRNGMYQLSVKSDVASFSARKNSVLTDKEVAAFEYIVSSFNQLFLMLKSEEIRA